MIVKNDTGARMVSKAEFSYSCMVLAALLVTIIHFVLYGFADVLSSISMFIPAASGVIVYDMLKHFQIKK